MKNHASLREKIEKYLAGEMDQEEKSRFLEEIQGDPEALRYLGESMEQQALLREIFTDAVSEVEAPAESTPSTTELRRVIQRRKRRPRRRIRTSWGARVRYGLTPVAAAAGILLVFHIVNLSVIAEKQRQLCAEVIQVRGGVEIIRGGKAFSANVGDIVKPTESINTGSDGYVELRYPDKTNVKLDKDTDISILEHEEAKRLEMRKGKLTADVERQKRGTPMIVDTPQAESEVLGTELAICVATEPALENATRLEVEEGTVKLTRKSDGQYVVVLAGYYAIADTGTGELVAMLMREPVAPGVGPTEPVIAQPAPQPAPEPAVATPAAGRVTKDLAALYTFNEASGTVIRDVASTDDSLHLRILEPNNVKWLPGGGLEIVSPTLIRSDRPAAKIVDACKAANEITVEAWITPARVGYSESFEKGARRIVTLSNDTLYRNFTLGQGVVGVSSSAYVMRLRSTTTDPNGMPCRSIDGVEVRTEKTHIMYTRSASGVVQFYVNGTPVRSIEHFYGGGGPFAKQYLKTIVRNSGRVGGDLSTWDSSCRFGLGNEMGDDLSVMREGDMSRAWLGTYHLVAVYSRALTADEVARNFREGTMRK